MLEDNVGTLCAGVKFRAYWQMVEKSSASFTEDLRRIASSPHFLIQLAVELGADDGPILLKDSPCLEFLYERW